MGSSRWKDSNCSDNSGTQCTGSDGALFTAGLNTPTSRAQQQVHTPTTSESGVHTEHDNNYGDVNPDISCTSSNPMPAQVSERVTSNGRQLWDVCKWAFDVELRASPRAAPASVNPSEGANIPEDRSSTTAKECLDTPETYSPGAPKLDPNHIFAAVIGEITRAAMKRFRSMQTLSSAKDSTDAYLPGSRIYPCLDSHEGPPNVVSVCDQEERDGVLVERPMDIEPGIWPCPFFVKDRRSHISCLTRHCLLSMTDVREHLSLMHRIPIYCSVCFETFPTVRLRDVHMRGWQCPRQPPVIFDGITDAQVYALDEHQRTSDTAPAPGIRQWLEIWEIVFPSTQPPSWPWCFTRRDFKVYELRRFWNKNGQSIISDVLKRDGFQQYNIKNEMRSLEALHSVVADHAVDDLLLIETTQDQGVWALGH